MQRRFADDAERDAVLLSAHDIRVAQEAITLARDDRAAGRGPAGAEPADPDQPRSLPDQPRGAPDQQHQAHDQTQAVPDQPTQPPGRTADQPSTAASSPPSWGTVLATTIRLWWQRHGPATPGQPALAGDRRGAPGRRRAGRGRPQCRADPRQRADREQRVQRRQQSGRGPPGGRHDALKTAAAARAAAARWLVQQAASDAIVSCDPQMCAAAQQAGLPAGWLQVLGTGASGPLSSDLLVATAAVRQEFGARLASVYAPDVLASFGTGSAQVAIRVVAPDGAAAYTASLRADQAARVSAGKQLLRNPRIHVSAPALPALANGQVDARLLTVFAALATLHSVRVLGFAAAPAGASPGLPLRTADLAPAGPGTRQQPNSVPSLASFLRAQLPPYRPATITQFRLPGGGAALRVEFAAPSPLGLLGKS